MKIRKLSIKNYKIFDNVELDFTDSEDNTLDTIILAGINGCGKTTLLQLISKLFSEDSNIFRLSTAIPVDEFTNDLDSILCDKITVEIELTGFARKAIKELSSNFIRLSKKGVVTNDDRVFKELLKTLKKLDKDSGYIVLEYELSIDNGKVTIIKNDFLLFAVLSSERLSKLFSIAYLISYYSDSSDFHKKNNKMTSESTFSDLIDGNKSGIVKDGIVSYIDAANKGDVGQYITKSVFEKLLKNPDITVKESLQQSVDFLNSPLTGINLTTKLDGVEDNEPIFRSLNGKKVKLRDLSAGEKNLFYRSSYLKMLELKDSILLVDEPEASLHPEWQQKILPLYKNAGINNQVIIATHSPFILSSVEPKSLFILSQDEISNRIIVLNREKDSGQPSKGLEPNRVLREIMGLKYLRDIEVQEKIESTWNIINDLNDSVDADILDSDTLVECEKKVEKVSDMIDEFKKTLGINDVEIVRIRHQLQVITRLLKSKKIIR